MSRAKSILADRRTMLDGQKKVTGYMLDVEKWEQLRDEIERMEFEMEQMVNVIHHHNDCDRILEDFREAIGQEEENEL